MRAVSGSSSPSPVRMVSVTRARMASVRGLSSIWAWRPCGALPTRESRITEHTTMAAAPSI
ncbi:hypothetical protein C0Q64_18555 [Streptomyces albidoflavus]|nr:hypothetical protein C0Q61_19545 [Streptomyces albidoflavus]RZD96880.1 hypothetical protein C0Q64_18555 [Streptomyces albidoflavus]RZD99558.1 hypothetical protein C0Q65_18805 [Streptomyces albidoflavus]RZE10467.1 hypothetical protein C0Q66_19855 [Streptomyces albidoflavus]